MLQLVKVRKRYSVKNEDWETLDTYNLDYDLWEEQLQFINTSIAKEAKNATDFINRINAYIEAQYAEAADFDDDLKTEEPVLEWKELTDFLNSNFSIAIYKNPDWSADMKKTAIKALNTDDSEEFNASLIQLFEIADKFESLREDTLDWVWYHYKSLSTESDNLQNQIEDKIAKLKEKKSLVDWMLNEIYWKAADLVSTHKLETIKTSSVSYSVRETHPTIIKVSWEEVRWTMPRKFYEKVVSYKPDARAIWKYLEELEEKWEKVDWAERWEKHSLTINIK